MSEFLERIATSGDPSEILIEAASHGPAIRQVSPHIYSSLFSSHVSTHSHEWYADAVSTSLQLLEDADVQHTAKGWLLEIAFHANLFLCDTGQFYSNLIQIDRALERFERRHVNRSSRYVRGLLAYGRDDLEGAEQSFVTMSALSDMSLLSHHAGYAAFRAPAFRRTLASYDPSIELNFIQGESGSNETSIVLLCAVDALYFVAFAEEFAAQVFRVSAKSHIHFHLVNTVEPSRLIESKVLADRRVSMSTEWTDATNPGKYTIMARYIILPLLMRRWKKPVLVTDIDMHIKADPGSLEIDGSAILGFRRGTMGQHVPAATIIGHHNLFMPDDAGLEIATMLSRYLHFMCESGRALWAADQVALLVVWRMFRNVTSIGSFREYPSYRYLSISGRPEKKKAAKERLHELMRSL